MEDVTNPARQLLDEAISLTEMSLHELEEDFTRYRGTRLSRSDRCSVQLWRMTVVNPDGSIRPPSPKLSASAEQFFEAARLFRHHRDLNNAMKAFYWSRRCCEKLKGDEHRQREIVALHGEAEIWMTLSEITPGEDARGEHHNRAADSFLRIAWLEEDLGVMEAALRAYSNAAHRYYLGDDLQTSAYTYTEDAARISENLEKPAEAAGYYEMAAQNLHRAKGATEMRIQASWYRKAGHQLRTIRDQKSRRAAISDLAHAATLELSDSMPNYTAAMADYWEASAIAIEAGDQAEADRLRYEYQKATRRKAWSEAHYFAAAVSYMSDWIWGYGLKSWRLVRTIVLSILVFAGIYVFHQEIQRASLPIDPMQDSLAYVVFCLKFSAYAMLPAEIIKWLTGIGLSVDFHIAGWSRIWSFIEGLLGLGYLIIGTALLKRKLKRVASAP